MAAASPQAPTQVQRGISYSHRRNGRVPHHILELSQCLLDFVVQLLPSKEESSVKEDVRKLLERLIKTIEPSAQLLSFGSTANGFELKNSDMDLCCILEPRSDPAPSASQFVLRASQLLEKETKFVVKPLPNARIPIIKLSLQPSPNIPSGIACDIGFENRLALENTRLLFTYAAIDPLRVRTLVLFLKLWSKRRKINSPYHGTLSSYGYVLLVVFFLVHVKDPPVLPNLQQMPPMRPISPSDTHIDGRNVWFFDDIDLLRRRWQSPNNDTIGELLLDFFRYFAREFDYARCVASIRAGHLSKESFESNKPPDPREGTSLWIEDPFETSFNVGRCVTRDGLYTIRGEFMRAQRILSVRGDPPLAALANLCEEREEEVPRSASQRNSFNPASYGGRYSSNGDYTRQTASAGGSPIAPRLGLSVPVNRSQDSFKPVFGPSTPITISAPSNGIPSSVSTSSSIPSSSNSIPAFGPSSNYASTSSNPYPSMVTGQPQTPFTPAVLPPTLVPPPHMAPQRSKWTSPPPDHAPPQRHNSFNERLASGIKLAVTHPHLSHSRSQQPARSGSDGSSLPDDVEVDNEEENGFEYGLGDEGLGIDLGDTTLLGDSRASSPASSIGGHSTSTNPQQPSNLSSIPEFKPRMKPPIRIQTLNDQLTPVTNTVPSTSRSNSDPTGNSFNQSTQWRQGFAPSESPLAANKAATAAAGVIPLPTLKIPSHPFFNPYSAGSSPTIGMWFPDGNPPYHAQFGPFSAPPPLSAGGRGSYSHSRESTYQSQGRHSRESSHRERDPPPHVVHSRENSHRSDGPRPNRSNSKSSYTGHSHGVPFGISRFGVTPGMTMGMAPMGVASTPVQLPTPPVSSPCSGLQITSGSPSPPMLRLEEGNVSAR